MKLFVRVAPIERIPTGYGMCWPCFDQDAHVFCPIPLNLALRPLRIAWFWARSMGCRGPAWEKELHKAFIAGVEIGRTNEQANVELYRARYEECFDLLMRTQRILREQP